jgi:hypothetical protein
MRRAMPVGPQRRDRAVTAACIVVAVAALLRVGSVALDQLMAPFDLSYETPNLRTIQLIQAGLNVYDPAVYAAPRFWITMYPPLYHLVVAALPAGGANPYLPGRLVAMTCMMLAGATVFLVPGRRVPVALLALGTFFLVRPVVSNTAFLKNDPMAALCSAVSIVLLARVPRTSASTASAAIAAVLAVCCKQSYVSALAAGGMFLALVDRRRLPVYFMAGPALLAALAFAARAAYGPGLWFSVLEAPSQPVTWAGFATRWRLMLTQPAFVATLMIVPYLATVGGGVRRLLDAPFGLYWAASLAVLLATVGKAGASINYFVEPALAAALWLVWLFPRDAPTGALPAAVAALAFGAAAELALADRSSIAFTTSAERATTASEFAAMATEIRATSDVRRGIVNLYEARFAPPSLGADVMVNDPYLYLLLWQSGRLDPAPLLDGLRESRFAGVLAPAGLLTDPPSGFYTPFQAALAGRYEVARRFGPVDYLTPLKSAVASP